MISGDDKWRKALVDSALDAVLIIDESGEIIDFNHAAEKMLGFQRDQVLGRNVAGVIIPPRLRASHAAGMERLKKSGVGRILGKRLEVPACRSDGSEFQVELVVSQVDDSPSPIYVGWIRDVSDQKQQEEALKSSEARFRALADASPVMIWQGAFNGHIDWFNRVWLEFTGMSLEQAVGLGWMEAIHPDDLQTFLREYHQALDDRGQLSIEYRLRNQTGNYHWVFAKMAPTLVESGSLIGYAGSCIDIQQRFESEEQQRLMQFTLDRAGDGVFMVAADSIVQYANDSACRMLGFPREELIGKSFCDFNVEIDLESWHEYWSQLKERREFTNESQHQRKDGSCYPVEININFMEFQGRELSCAFVRDITERQVAKQKLTTAVQDAQSANQAKSEFLAIVSHEMRTPLNGILGLVDLTLDTSLNEEQTGMLNVCRQSGAQLKKLIDDMLDFSQIERGKFSLASEWFDLHEVLNRLNDCFAEQACEKNLEFHWEVQNDIPKWVGGDSRRLYQVIDNLLGNAIKFTNQGYISFRALVESQSTNLVELRFTVEDSGIGIHSDDIQRIFRKFERVDATATRDQGGVGLGLAICHQLAKQMNGEIEFEPTDQKGSRFHFIASFSMNPANPKSPSGPDQQRFAITNSGIKFPKVTVLLVEDDAPSRMVAKRILEQTGVKVIIARDGVEAIELYHENSDRISAIFMDITMPRLDGVSAQQEIRKSGGRDLPIIAMTAQAMKGDREHLLESGFDEYVSKPISRARVIRALADALPRTMLDFQRDESERTADSNAVQIVDLKKLLDHCGNDREQLVAVIECFNEACADSIYQIEVALEKRDVEALTSVAHRLRGSVANMSAQQVLNAADEFERLARNLELDQLIKQWPNFHAELLVLCRELQNAAQTSP